MILISSNLRYLHSQTGLRNVWIDMVRDEDMQKYERNKVTIGRTRSGQEVKLNFKNSFRSTTFGVPGAGKTFLARGIMDRAYMAGIAPVMLTDIKPEYYSSKRPAQEKFNRPAFYLENEHPTGMPVKSYYPKFFKSFVRHAPGVDEAVALKFSYLNFFDFMTIMNIDMSSNMKTFLEKHFGSVTKSTTIEEFINLIMSDQTSGFQKSARAAVAQRIQNLKTLGVIDDASASFSFNDDIANGVIPLLNLFGIARMGENISYASAFIAKIIREIMAAKNEGAIPKDKKIFINIEEASRFLFKNSTSRYEIEGCVREGRQYGISINFVIQTINDLPSELLDKMDYIFVPYTVSASGLREIFKEFGFMKGGYYDLGIDVAELKQSMRRHKDGTRDWLMIDRIKKRHVIFQPLAPLSYHLEEF